MRIQHNIAAMNSYRNFSRNTSGLNKNLEKLSSGYRINRAGDDAAGLAISEKMRAQISGLSQAQANAKSGINLVQTAEGALTEVHDMLNRMVTLSEQSANGTFDDATDRANLEKEFKQLSSEIDRIADSSNFNGIKLLDGSLSGKGTTTGSIAGGFEDIRGALAAGVDDVAAVKAKSTLIVGALSSTATVVDGSKFTLTLGMSDGTQKEFTVTAKVDAKTNATTFIDQDGNELTTKLAAASASTAGDLSNSVLTNVMRDAVAASEFGKDYAVTADAANGKIALEAKVGGTNTAHVTSVGLSAKTKAGVDIALATSGVSIDKANSKEGVDAYKGLNLNDAVTYDGTNLDKAVFEINGEKFVFVDNGKLDDDAIAALRDAGVSHYVETAVAGTVTGAVDVKKMVEKIKMATGLDVTQGSVSATGVWTDGVAGGNTHIKLNDGVSSKANSGLTLQIGDTSDDFNQLNVAISDMHVKALGLSKSSIANQTAAKEAFDTIKAAINSVSSTRGDLGALQNRLDHTINNLSVMEENIQDAEATIRDVDVAQEMMAYTKNNILVQASQAMLAQANQLPQGVLQLLQ